MSDDIFLPLTVSVDADEWAFAQRRQRYLEAVLVQVLRDRRAIREWFGAAELAGLRLPGLPTTKRAVARLATAQRWRRRATRAQGGTRWEYHYAALPPRAFDMLVACIIGVPGDDELPYPPTDEPLPQLAPAGTEAPPALSAVENTAPPWVLPLMRLLRGPAGGDLAAAWRELPRHLPAGVDLPDRTEAAEVICRLGLFKAVGESD